MRRSQAVEQFLLRERIQLPSAPNSDSTSLQQASSSPPEMKALSETQPAFRPATARWQEQYEQVQQFFAEGVSIIQIGKRLHLARNTVRRYLRQACTGTEHLTRAPRRPRQSRVAQYHAYLLKRWQDGCHNAAELWRELRSQGFNGGASTVRGYLARHQFRQSKPTRRNRPRSPQELRWLLCRKSEELHENEQVQLAQLLETEKRMNILYDLTQRFLAMVREQQAPLLASWLQEALNCDVDELRSFAQGILQDQAAVLAALSLPWSHDHVA